jgi:DNA-binding response OmpR family regulator
MAWQCDHCGAVHEDAALAERIFGDLSIIRGSRELYCNDRRINLQPMQEAIIFDLMSGKPTSREALMMRHARSEETFDKTLNSHLHAIRAKLRDLRTIVQIRALHGLGWQMIIEGRCEYEQHAFGDAIFDFDRRIVFKGQEIAAFYPITAEAFRILLSGDLEPREKFIALVDGGSDAQRKHNARTQIRLARDALKQIGSSIEIRNFEKLGYQMRMPS